MNSERGREASGTSSLISKPTNEKLPAWQKSLRENTFSPRLQSSLSLFHDDSLYYVFSLPATRVFLRQGSENTRLKAHAQKTLLLNFSPVRTSRFNARLRLKSKTRIRYQPLRFLFIPACHVASTPSYLAHEAQS